MGLPYTSDIIAAYEAETINIIPLIEVEFIVLSPSVKAYWSTVDVPAADVVTWFPSAFEARIAGIGPIVSSLGSNDDETTLLVGDGDGTIATLLAANGNEIFIDAIVKIHHLLKNDDKLADTRQLFYGRKPTYNEATKILSWPLSQLSSQFNRKILRTVQPRCALQFPSETGHPRDSCPYDPANGIGDYETLPSTPFTSCDKSISACSARGMYSNGPDGRRYWTGFAEAARLRIPAHKETGEKSRFAQSSLGNKTYNNEIIPVVVSNFRIRDLTSYHHVNDGRFEHGFFYICEGEIYDINPISINGFHPDNVGTKGNTDNPITTNAGKAQHDSLLVFGTRFPGGIDDAAAVDLVSAIRIHNAIGRKKHRAVKTNTILDGYVFTGTPNVGSPYPFVNPSTGNGPSFSGIVGVKVRIESHREEVGELSGTFDIVGKAFRQPVGTAANASDSQREISHVFSTVTYRWSLSPNPIQVLYDMLLNKEWGGGFDVSNLLNSAFIAESDYCEEPITYGVAEPTAINTTIKVNGGKGSIVTPHEYYIIIPDVNYPSGSLAGSMLYTNKDTVDEEANRIAYNYQGLTHREVLSLVGAGRIPSIAGNEQSQYTVLSMYKDPSTELLDEDDGGDIPDPGLPGDVDPIPNDPGYNIKAYRYKAEGVLTNHVELAQAIDEILKHCAGTWRMNQGKIEPLIYKQLTTGQIDTIEAEKFFTVFPDSVPAYVTNAVPNILYGDSATYGNRYTFSVDTPNLNDIPNVFVGRFFDRRFSYLENSAFVEFEELQRRQGGGSRARREKVEFYSLCSSVEQLARLLAIDSRRAAFESVVGEFYTSIRGAGDLLPGDIICLDGRMFTSLNLVEIPYTVVTGNGNILARITNIEQSEGLEYTFKIEWHIHINGIYDDTATAVGSVFRTRRDGPVESSKYVPIKVNSLTERVGSGQDGGVRDFIETTIEWPIINQD